MPKKTSPAAGNSPASAAAPRQLTCFVVTGFGNKTDYATGRVLNLDKTYEQLVRPACDAVKVNAFRAIDANLTGSIDSVMYRWIYQADMVIADLSTLNANVFYELGVRHAQRPNTTVIIAESVLVQKIPFDLSSFVIHKYEHGGEAISAQEATRFVAHLSGVLRGILDNEQLRLQTSPDESPETDSPVFHHLSGMRAPLYKSKSFIPPPAYVPPEQRATTVVAEGDSLASLIEPAEAAKKAKKYVEAIRLFALAMQMQIDRKTITKPGQPKILGKPDLFLAQRLALVTYKEGETRGADGQLDKKRAVEALIAAEDILAKYCDPNISTDPETLGLSGAINKRRFELGDGLGFLEQAIRFYERGFYVKQDYYSGINVAYMYTQRANLLTDRFDAIVSYGHANMIRAQVAKICQALIDDQTAFAERGDQEWVYTSLAEAYQGMALVDKEAALAAKIDAVASDFAKQTYSEQKGKLGAAMAEFNAKFRPGELNAKPGLAQPAGATPASAPPLDLPAAAFSGQTSFVGSPTGQHPITIDAHIAQGRTIKSVEVNCKIEYF